MAKGQVLDASLEIPDVVLLTPGRKTVNLDVVCRVQNPRSENFVVGATSEGEVHDWHLLDENHKEVQRAPKKAAKRGARGKAQLHPFTTRMVPGTHAHSQHQTIALDAGKLKPGRCYTLRYEFWGHISEADFTVAAAPTAPPKKPAPPARKRRAAPKKARPAARKARPAARKARPAARKARPAARKARPAAKKARPAAKKAKAAPTARRRPAGRRRARA